MNGNLAAAPSASFSDASWVVRTRSGYSAGGQGVVRLIAGAPRYTRESATRLAARIDAVGIQHVVTGETIPVEPSWV